jgi:hypothetical protein
VGDKNVHTCKAKCNKLVNYIRYASEPFTFTRVGGGVLCLVPVASGGLNGLNIEGIKGTGVCA